MPVTILNFTYPLTGVQIEAIKKECAPVDQIINVPVCIDQNQPIRNEAQRICDKIEGVQEGSYLLVNLPSFAPLALTLAEALNFRFGALSIIRLKAVQSPAECLSYEFAELFAYY